MQMGGTVNLGDYFGQRAEDFASKKHTTTRLNQEQLLDNGCRFFMCIYHRKEQFRCLQERQHGVNNSSHITTDFGCLAQHIHNHTSWSCSLVMQSSSICNTHSCYDHNHPYVQTRAILNHLPCVHTSFCGIRFASLFHTPTFKFHTHLSV